MFDNPVLTHADVVLPQSAPSGSPFSATDAAVSTGFSFNPPLPSDKIRRMEWRILIQVCAMQYTECMSQNGDREQWKSKILDTLQRTNQKAQMFNPQSIPSDIVPPTEEYRALSASGENWCDTLTRQLACLFLNVTAADTLRTEQE